MIDTVLLIANRGEIALPGDPVAPRALGLRTVARLHRRSTAPRRTSAPPTRRSGSAVLPRHRRVLAAAARDAAPTRSTPATASSPSAPPSPGPSRTPGLILVGPSADGDGPDGPQGRRPRDRDRRPASRSSRRTTSTPTPTSFDFPVLVKAAAGGGGKGMRIVRSADEYADAVAAARREAQSRVRRRHHAHREVRRVRAAHRGAGARRRATATWSTSSSATARPSAGTRRCSRRRRPRPSPPSSATQVTSAAVALAAQVGYENAGTVEFLLDNATGEAYFLEMNTRLQVEHPVTELLVDRAVRSTSSRSSSRSPRARRCRSPRTTCTLDGHAIEARVYAEDSFGGFLPQAGTADAWCAGRPRPRRRTRSRPARSSRTSYDPMLGKVIVHGPDREAARRALVAGARRHRDPRASPPTSASSGRSRPRDEFRDATIDTAWLDPAERAGPGRRRGPDLRRLGARHAGRGARRPGPVPRATAAGSAPPRPRRAVELDGAVVLVDRASRPGRRRPGRPSSPAEQHVVRLEVDGRRVQAVGRRDRARGRGGASTGSASSSSGPTSFADARPGGRRRHLLAPMPGTVLAVDVAEGDAVEEGQRLGVLEAMKMELALKAPFAGTVDHRRCRCRRPGRRSARCSSTVEATIGRSSDLPDQVTIYEVGPRDGLQNEKGIVPVEAKAEFIHRLLAAGLPDRRGHQLRAPEVGAPAGRRRRADGRCSATTGTEAARCWSPTSAAWTGRSSWAASTSRSSAAPPRPSRSATSTAAWTSSSRCSSPPSRGPARPGWTCAPT